MEKLEYFGEKPSNMIVLILLLISIPIIIVSNVIMSHFLTLSGFPTNQVVWSEICFSGAILKQLYTSILGAAGLQAYIMFEIVDYLFMIGYGLLIFSLGLLICRKFDDGSFFRKSGYIITVFGIAAPLFDAGENAFILLTLTDIVNFPDIWAIGMSAFSVVKWAMIFIALVWAIVAGIALLVNKFKN